MSVWVVVESCCNHFDKVFSTEALAKEYCDRIQGYHYLEIKVRTEVTDDMF